MSQFTPALEAALSEPTVLIFGAVKIELPNYTLCLLDGSGMVSFGGNDYVGLDPTFGTLSDIDDLTDGGGEEAPRIGITLLPSGDAAAAQLASPTMQGSLVSVFMGVLDPVTGIPIPDPYLLFLGELDVPTLVSSANGRRLEYTVASVFERLFADDEGARLSPGFHKSVWPGELGLDKVTGVEDTIYWGVEGPRGSVRYGGDGASGGFANRFVLNLMTSK